MLKLLMMILPLGNGLLKGLLDKAKVKAETRKLLLIMLASIAIISEIGAHFSSADCEVVENEAANALIRILEVDGD